MPSVLKVKLMEYNSRIKLMSILCNRSSNFNNKVKNLLSFLTILISAGIAIITSIFDSEKMKIPIIILNSCIVLFLSLDRSFKFSEKTANFQKYSQNYNRLSHDIDKKCNVETSIEFLNLIISLYDNITDAINDEFPSRIVNRMKQEYKTTDKRFLPLILIDEKYEPTDVGEVSPVVKSRDNTPILQPYSKRDDRRDKRSSLLFERTQSEPLTTETETSE